MVTDEETLPFDIRMVTPGTPEYEEGVAIRRAYRLNRSYYEQHETELLERFPGPCNLVVYNGCEARSFTDIDEMLEMLDTLDRVERSAALDIPVPEPGVAWIL